MNRLVEIFVGNYRENRSENFGFHNAHVGGDSREYGCGRVAVFDVFGAEFRAADDGLRTLRNRILNERLVALDGAAFNDVYKNLGVPAGVFGFAVHLLYVVCNGVGERLH